MSFANYWENEILDHIFGKGSYTAPSNIYVGLSAADPLDDASGLSEPSGGSYARVQTSPADWNAASGGSITNASRVTFTTSTAVWGTMTHVCIFDAATAGNLLASGSLSAPAQVLNNNTCYFEINDLEVTLT